MHQPQIKKKKAFTLVELIIVITILAILGTIAFISFQGYTKDTRDSVRLTDVKSIYDGLSIYKIQTSTTLLPDDYIEIQSGTTTISYQGYAGVTVQRGINLKNGGTDPLSKNYYIYTTDISAKKIQLMTYLETADKDVELLSYNYKLDNLTNNLNLINQVYSSNTDTGYYEDKKIYVYGDKIGILTDENNVPLQETITSTGINLVTNTGSITTYFGGDVYDNGKSTNTGTTLINEINGAINNTLPCSPTTHEGYEITSLQDSQSGSFTKPLTISNGTGTGTIIATCNNGVLSYSEPVNNISCVTTDYVPNGTNDGCIENVCNGTLPENAELNGTQELGSTWSYSTISGVCKYQCQSGFHTEDSGASCVSNTNPLTCGGSIPQYTTGTTSSTYNQTWNGSSWSSTYSWGENQAVCDFDCISGYSWNGSSCELNKYTVSGIIINGSGGIINLCGTNVNINSSGNFTLTNINYGTNCGSISVTRSGYSCSISTDGPNSLISNTSNIAGSCSLLPTYSQCSLWEGSSSPTCNGSNIQRAYGDGYLRLLTTFTGDFKVDFTWGNDTLVSGASNAPYWGVIPVTDDNTNYNQVTFTNSANSVFIHQNGDAKKGSTVLQSHAMPTYCYHIDTCVGRKSRFERIGGVYKAYTWSAGANIETDTPLSTYTWSYTSNTEVRFYITDKFEFLNVSWLKY